MSRLEYEYKILNIVGSYSRIIVYKTFTKTGLYLESVLNGIIYHYLIESNHPAPLSSNG